VTLNVRRSCLIVFTLALAWPAVDARTAAVTPAAIRVAVDNNYAPFSFQSNGTLQGILIDQWRAWEVKTGIRADIRGLNWEDAVRRMRAGEFDVIDSIVATDERRAYFDFTPPYATVETSIYFRREISGISDLASLRDFPVAVKAGDQHIDQLKSSGVTSLILFPDHDAIVEAAKAHKINAFVVDDPSALYLLAKRQIDGEFRHSAPIFRDELRRAVRKGDTSALRTVTQGFAAITPGELQRIDEKWFGRTINRFAVYLTYAAYAAVVTVPLFVSLLGWNHTLRRGILQRTAALSESEQRLRQIAVRLMHTQDAEQRRIARMLHETTAQDLAALVMQLERLERTCDQLRDTDRAVLTESIAIADRSMTDLRTLSYLLHPPCLDEAGLASALRWYATGFAERSGLKVDLDMLEDSERLPLDTETTLFRIVQESLTNIHRHAKSKTARIRLRRDATELVLDIEDRGAGIAPAALTRIMLGGGGSGVGVAGMRERIEQLGGRLEITSSDQGTIVRVRLPLGRDGGTA
jgi:signal transduction histidine kinase